MESTESSTNGLTPHPEGPVATRPIGCIDGSADATTRRFHVVLDDDATVELDELVVCRQTLPDGSGALAHYGSVVEQTIPGQTVRRAEIQVLRTLPERWLAPEPGAVVTRALGGERDAALFVDQ